VTQVARGSTYTWTATVRDGNRDLADAADLTFTIADPDGDELTGFPEAIPPIVRDSLGEYHYDWAIPAGQELGTYNADWAGTVDGLAIGGSDSVEVIDAGTIVSDIVTIAEVRARITTDLLDAQLEDIITTEAAWLARRIGPLEGTRTVRAWRVDADLDTPIFLRRPTDTVVVSDYGTDIDAADLRLLADGTKVELATGPWTGPWVDVTSTPNDLEEVKRVVIELVRLTVTETGYASERIGEYSYNKGSGQNPAQAAQAARNALVRDLLPLAGPGSIRLRSSIRPERVGEATSA
jgi:hypothetical protein